MPSKTPIQPLNIQFIPKTEEEKERVLKTVYVTNIDRLVKEQDLRNAFELTCGKILYNKLKLWW